MQVDNWAVKLAAMACVFRPAGEGETAAASFCLLRLSAAAQALKREKERGIFSCFTYSSFRCAAQGEEFYVQKCGHLAKHPIHNLKAK